MFITIFCLLQFPLITVLDIQFIVEGKTIHAHRVILAARCEYYRSLWMQNWHESHDSVLEISEWQYDTFFALLTYVLNIWLFSSGRFILEAWA